MFDSYVKTVSHNFVKNLNKTRQVSFLIWQKVKNCDILNKCDDHVEADREKWLAEF